MRGKKNYEVGESGNVMENWLKVLAGLDVAKVRSNYV